MVARCGELEIANGPGSGGSSRAEEPRITLRTRIQNRWEARGQKVEVRSPRRHGEGRGEAIGREEGKTDRR